MSAPLENLHEAVSVIDAAWVDADQGLGRSELLSVNAAIGSARRALDALQARVAAGIAHESRPELGAESLAKQAGFRIPAALIAATTGVSTGDAGRLVKVGEAVAPRADLVGDRMPPKYPGVDSALSEGMLGAAASAVIVELLDRVRVGRDADEVADVEARLVERAVGLSLDDVRRLVKRAEMLLEEDRLEAREEERRAARSLTYFEKDGNFHLYLVTPVEEGAPIRAALDGYVTAQFQARKDEEGAGAGAGAGGADEDRRTVAMMRADGLMLFCEHVLDCGASVPVAGATVIVRIGLDDLEAGTGHGTIDGIDQPVSVAAVRRMAASGGVIPCVLDGSGEILDWGRERRLFTPAQKLALAERDGGCARCGLPPGMTKAHHLAWWKRDAGPTDLSNGVLLCESCHHRIHDNGWDIRIDDPPGTSVGTTTTRRGTGVNIHARVWFIPPAHVDPARTPQLGGRARYDIAA
ncbi:HNH endonuclease signature motif containing protein [uncultured Microbacterium sp.]|uniref:HNH endonuclease n=1 Tax=uncultured Microbacterium sp. TaxID=191216 RepID=UPI00260CB7BB|nr:HNH endonuclease signature motif containing protein [uncultured Microbacterium sp.]